MSSLTDTLRNYCNRLELALAARLPEEHSLPNQLHTAMRYSTLSGGKRIRASLVYATGQSLGAPLSALDIPACAVEIIHSFSLVHDDMPCMDDDDLRRGKPTCHKAFDEATALLVGDALQSLAFDMLATDPALAIDSERRLRMVGVLARAVGSYGMAGGQAIDIESVGQTLSPERLEDMHRRKTGELIHASVMLGALSAETSGEAVLAALDQYGEAIGLAFQVVDDILDVTADTETLGKPQGSDQAQNKPTYPSILGLDAARNKAEELYQSALASLAPLGDNGTTLGEIADYIVHRNQ
ncbi:MAG: (2E,6E)-farnesyl diphosphate synthase [Acidiferrobacterales bacterium]|nr:(2E,6E)-farnesyl diphosphate synthase [Acidiferrobacterales bacterium]